MKIVIAPDSYKGSVSARLAAATMAEGVLRALPDAEVVQCPMGDGGEGTLSALVTCTGAEVRYAEVLDAYGELRRAAWGWNPGTLTAYLELAEACGLQCLDISKHSILDSTTYGVGQLVRETLDAGARSLVLTLGGSATNDAGAGMMVALGGRLLDRNGLELPLGAGNLTKVDRVDLSGLDPRLEDLDVMAAVDVDNPLLGPNGASSIYGPQKGATAMDVKYLDDALETFAAKVASAAGADYKDYPGAGAAGGMGYAAKALFKATLKPGIQVVMEQVGFERALDGTDLVITGEGRLDGQSLAGKTPLGISRVASKKGIPVVVIAGQLGDGWRASYQHGVTAAFSLTDGPMSLQEAVNNSSLLLADRCEAVARLYSF
ncbi:glycerate kinase [Billgrantia diversa]|uniref:glycerate kinase n=1 Tax=Halomonas sp. MCCC 1A13316 TaxID=2733487 RepID=UPI0018A37959|nr:glycerate kinase [Halomonas sp. MCCC 1A13316]QOR37151.1 glycerate kinase [Halomonas sp. MCCC 1A13316]